MVHYLEVLIRAASLLTVFCLRADAFLCPFGDLVYIQVCAWGEREGSSFAKVSCSGLNIQSSYVLLGSLAEVKEPAKLAAQVQYTQLPPFWISGRVGVLLTTSEVVYEWPPRGWRVPWWPSSLSMDTEQTDAEALASQKLRVDELLGELDTRIEQEEREAREALQKLASPKLPPNMHKSSFRHGERDQEACSRDDTKDDMVADGAEESSHSDMHRRQKTVAEQQIETLMPWLALRASDTLDEARAGDDRAHDVNGREEQEAKQEQVHEDAKGSSDEGEKDAISAIRRDSWGIDTMFLLEMFPDVDPSKIYEELVECGDDMQKVADLLLLSQSERSNSLHFSIENMCENEDVLHYDYGFHLEDEELRQEQINVDHQIARDYQLAFEMYDAEDAGNAPPDTEGNRHWAGKVEGQEAKFVGARQKQRQQHLMPIPANEWQPGPQGGSLSERLQLRQLDDLCREFSAVGVATVQDVWEGCQHNFELARQSLRFMTSDGKAEAAAFEKEDYSRGYRYRYQGFPEVEEDFEQGDVVAKGSSGVRKTRKNEWQVVAKDQRMVWERDDALEEKILAELGVSGSVGQDLLDMLRYREKQHHTEVGLFIFCKGRDLCVLCQGLDLIGSAFARQAHVSGDLMCRYAWHWPLRAQATPSVRRSTKTTHSTMPCWLSFSRGLLAAATSRFGSPSLPCGGFLSCTCQMLTAMFFCGRRSITAAIRMTCPK
jgi:hypothetical protein